MDKSYYVYIMTSKRNGTLYTGVTSNLKRRIYEHKTGMNGGFSSQYKTTILVYYEVHGDVTSAITREKQIKNWHRAWKVRLIEEKNPYWNDLYGSL